MKFRVLLLVAILLVIGLNSADAAVALDYVRATANADGTIEIEWRTATEDNTAGFSLKRSTTPPDNAFITDTSGPFIQFTEEGSSSSTDFIDARGSTVAGDTYTVIDSNVTAGNTYYYLLVETVFSGGRTPYGDDIASVTLGNGNNNGGGGIGNPTATPVTPTAGNATATTQPTATSEPTSTVPAGAPTSTPRPTNTTAATATTAPTATSASGDGSAPEPTATGRVFITPSATPRPTDTQEPTDTPAPTDTAEPTSTTEAGQPTSTPRPTNTPPPTSTPRPTNTPLPADDSNVVATPITVPTETPAGIAAAPVDSNNPPAAEAQDDGYPADDPSTQVDPPVSDDPNANSDEPAYVEPDTTSVPLDGLGENSDPEGILGDSNSAPGALGGQTVAETNAVPTGAVQESNEINPLLWLVFGAGILVFGAGVVGSILIFTRKQDNV